ncbi:MAG: O-antigen ligase family protein [Elusimicrobia bacterium]|nr:O-antigen ligase family protein [Elusimicrobiota bacterium]
MAASLWGEAERRLWFWALTVCAAVLAACAVLVEVPGYPCVGVLPPYYNYTCFVEAALFSAAFAALRRQDGPRGALRWALAAAAAAALMEMLWAHSRGALAAAAAGSALFMWRNDCRRRLLPVAGVLAVVLAFATWAKLDVAQSFKRPQIWKAAAECVRDHPILGAGPGRFAEEFLRHNFPAGYGPVNFRARADHAHSEVLEAMAELGLPGLLLLLAALWASLKPPPAGHSTWTQEAGLAAFAAMSVQCCTDNMLQLPALGLLYVSALAVAREPASDAAPAGLPAWRALAWAGLLLAAVAWVPGRLVGLWQASGRPEALLRAVRLAPADPYLREDLYWALLSQRPPRVEEALVQLSRAESLSPFNAVYPKERSRLLAGRGEWPQALAAADRALALEPDYLSARLSRAEALLSLGRRTEARGELVETGRRDSALGPRPEGGTGYEAFILGFDRAAYERLVLRAASD